MNEFNTVCNLKIYTFGLPYKTNKTESSWSILGDDIPTSKTLSVSQSRRIEMLGSPQHLRVDA